MNLLTETISDIETSGHVIEDIIFIGSEHSGHQCSWEQFTQLANKEYSNGYGGTEVATDLIIVFSDGSKMWRREYDGSEWWEFSEPFKMPKGTKPIASVFSRSSFEDTLKEIHRRD